MPEFTQDELDALCRPAPVRLSDAFASGVRDEVVATYLAIIAAIRDIADLYSAWTAVTLAWLQERYGTSAVAAVLPVHELLPGGPESALTEQETSIVRSVLRAGDEAQTERIAAATSAEELLRTWADIHAAVDHAEILRRDTATVLLSVIHERYGAEALEDALRYATDRIWMPRMQKDLTFSPTERLRNWAVKMSSGHTGTVSVVEHEDRWVITLDPCGSCRRQIQAGRYRPPWNFAVVAEGFRVGFLRPDITVYQAHLAVAHTMVPIERTGAPWPAVACSGLDGGSCDLVLYRDASRTAPEFYAQVGAAKP